jgi:hypothetical protein
LSCLPVLPACQLWLCFVYVPSTCLPVLPLFLPREHWFLLLFLLCFLLIMTACLQHAFILLDMYAVPSIGPTCQF